MNAGVRWSLNKRPHSVVVIDTQTAALVFDPQAREWSSEKELSGVESGTLLAVTHTGLATLASLTILERCGPIDMVGFASLTRSS